MHFAIYLTHSRSDALEIVNDVFVNVWNKRSTLNLDDSLKSYLFSSVKNRCTNFLKKKKLQIVSELPNDGVSSFTADKGVEEKEQLERLHNILNILPPKCKQIFVMSRMDELTYKEIAELLELSVKTIEAQMSKALKIFREKLIKK